MAIALSAIPEPVHDALVAGRCVDVAGAEAAALATAVGITVPVGALIITPWIVQQQLMGTVTLARATAFPHDIKAALAVLTAQVLMALESIVLTEDLLRREERFRALVQNTSDLIAVVDPAGTITYVSPSVALLLGYTPAALLGTAWAQYVHPDDAVRFPSLEAGARASGEVRIRHRDGAWRILEVMRTNLRDEPGIGGIVVNAHDVTERKAFEEQLRHQAFHDQLTGLPNRALFADRLDHALAWAGRAGGSVAVLFLDLDRFKVVNDSLGHEAGDRLLVAVAARLTACVRGLATVARFGGDEFAILLGDLAEESEAVRIAGRIVAELDRPHLQGMGHLMDPGT